jgi:hypothetical protein
MLTSYEKRFGNNGDLMHAYANDNSPRIAEIKHLYDKIRSQKSKRVLNVPFEGNLIRSIDRDLDITFADFVVPDTLQSWNIMKTDHDLNDIPSNYFDAVLSIAGIHHLTDHEQLKFLIATKRVLTTNGCLLMVEVKDHSPTSRFLDEFVGKHTATGHVGNYLKDNFVSTVALAGYANINREKVTHEWVFANTDYMIAWMSTFFGLAGVSRKTLLDQVENILGVNEKDKTLTVNWELDFIHAQS